MLLSPNDQKTEDYAMALEINKAPNPATFHTWSVPDRTLGEGLFLLENRDVWKTLRFDV